MYREIVLKTMRAKRDLIDEGTNLSYTYREIMETDYQPLWEGAQKYVEYVYVRFTPLQTMHSKPSTNSAVIWLIRKTSKNKKTLKI